MPGGKEEVLDETESTLVSWPEAATVASRVAQFSNSSGSNKSPPGTESMGSEKKDMDDEMLDSLLGKNEEDSISSPSSTGRRDAEKEEPNSHQNGKNHSLSTSHRHFHPTVPQSPKLHKISQRPTNRSRGVNPESEVSMAASIDLLKRELRSSRSADSSDSKPLKLTVPKSPSFHKSHRQLLSNTSSTPDSKEEYSLAQSTARLANMLRSGSSPVHSPEKETSPSLTVPNPPKFQEIHRRQLPKSTAEKEAELTEFYSKYQFRARPIMKRSRSASSSLGSPKTRGRTETRAFRLRSAERSTVRSRLSEAKSQDELDLEECQKKFHARPAPVFDRSPNETIPASSPTTPRPFKLSESNRRRSRSVDHAQTSIFRARPVPSSTYRSDSVGGFCDASSHASTVAEAPVLTTSDRSSHRRAAKEEYERKADQVRHEKEEMVKQQKVRLHEEAMKKAREPTTINVPDEPFQLQSNSRHREYQKRRAAQLALEEEKAKRLMEFHARPLVKSPVKKVTKSATPPTAAEPFSLASTSRHDAFEIEHKRRVMREEADLKQMREFKLPNKSRKILEKAGRIPGYNLAQHQQGVDKSNMPIWSWRWFSFAVLFRVLNVFLVQSYFDPDEFWQTMEPSYCEVFKGDLGYDCPGFTWEWKRRAPADAKGFLDYSMQGPARTYLSVIPTFLFYSVLKNTSWDTYWMVSRGPMFLYAVTVAAPIDLAVWYIARWLSPSQFVSRRDIAGWALFCSLVSWFNGYSLVRTLANSQEAQALVIAIALVSPELVGGVKARYSFFRSCLAFFVGGLGVCIRFTSVAAFIPMGVLLALQLKQTGEIVQYLFVPCALFGLAGLGVGLVVDRLMFGFWTLPFMGNFHFNVVLDYASLYGAHPWHWYFTAGLPTLSGLLLPFLVVDAVETLKGHTCYGKRNLWIVATSYLVVMSFNDHKEFRYILPVLPVFCLLSASRVRDILHGDTFSSRLRFCLFVLANLVAVLYLGMFHQIGPISVNRQIVSSVQHIPPTVETNSSKFVIHYLTGACHSTPLLSSLHLPRTDFETWALDCSPDCRADPERLCEKDQFDKDPVEFLSEAYFSCHDEDSEGGDVCETDSQPSHPDFVVTFSKYSERIRPQLEQLGLHLTARFPHNLNGARYGGATVGEDYYSHDYRHFLIGGELEISLDEIVLFSRFPSKT